jgi:hypothetical protein
MQRSEMAALENETPGREQARTELPGAAAAGTMSDTLPPPATASAASMPMTPAERALFDCQGFLVRPGVLDADTVAELRDAVDTMEHAPHTLPAHRRRCPGGCTSLMIDHPAVLGVLHEILGPEVRCEAAGHRWREKGERDNNALHRGGSERGRVDPVSGYRVHNGLIHAGMVRVIVELNDVGPQDGATHFLPGSNNMNLDMEPSILAELDAQLERGEYNSGSLCSYSCPAGSVLFFAEATIHAGPTWRSETPRICLFNSYTPLTVNSRWPREPYLDPVVLAGLPLEKLAYFRPPWEAMWSPDAAGQHANTVAAFKSNPDMGWAAPARIVDAMGSDAAAAHAEADADGAESGGSAGARGVIGQLRSVETMVDQGVMSEKEGRAVRARILGLPCSKAASEPAAATGGKSRL